MVCFGVCDLNIDKYVYGFIMDISGMTSSWLNIDSFLPNMVRFSVYTLYRQFIYQIWYVVYFFPHIISYDVIQNRFTSAFATLLSACEHVVEMFPNCEFHSVLARNNDALAENSRRHSLSCQMKRFSWRFG